MSFRPVIQRAIPTLFVAGAFVTAPFAIPAQAGAPRSAVVAPPPTSIIAPVLRHSGTPVTRVPRLGSPSADSAATRAQPGVTKRGHGAAIFYGVVAAGTVAAFELRIDPDAGGYEDGWQTKAPFPDKVVHALASFALTSVGADVGARPWLAATTVCAAGAAFEYSQGYVSYMDISANCIGAAGAALWKGWTRRRDARAGSPGTAFFAAPSTRPIGALPARLDISVGGTRRYANTSIPVEAVLRAGDSTDAVPAWSVLWETRPLGRMRVSSDGVAELIAPGRVEVRAHTATHRASTRLRIEDNPVAEVVAVAEAVGDVYPGDSVRIAAIARDHEGRKVPDVRLRFMIAGRGAADAAPEARIGGDGLFVADSAGLHLVLIESNGLAARVPVLVKPRPIVVARTRGDDVPAASGIARLATVSVTAAPTARVRVSSPDYEPYVGTSVRLRGRVWTEGLDEPDTMAIPVWETSNPDVALVDHRGTVMFLRPGFVTISATHGGRTARRRVQVWPSPAVRVVLRSDARYPRAGDIVKLTDHAWQRGGLPVHHARANLAIVNHDRDIDTGATISEDRKFIARMPGTYTVLAELNGLASTVTFTVHPAGARCELRLRKWDPSCDR